MYDNPKRKIQLLIKLCTNVNFMLLQDLIPLQIDIIYENQRKSGMHLNQGLVHTDNRNGGWTDNDR